MKRFKGTGVAIVTPFKNDYSIDFAAFGRVINHVIDGGVNYIVAMGTTGESVTLTKDEKKALISYVVEVIDNSVPLVVGIGGNNTQEVINYIKAVEFKRSGRYTYLLLHIITSQVKKVLFQHFKAIANMQSSACYYV